MATDFDVFWRALATVERTLERDPEAASKLLHTTIEAIGVELAKRDDVAQAILQLESALSEARFTARERVAVELTKGDT